MKSNYLSEKYELEDKIIKYYPTTIARIKETIAGLATVSYTHLAELAEEQKNREILSSAPPVRCV